jgi:hypothetical protein
LITFFERDVLGLKTASFYLLITKRFLYFAPVARKSNICGAIKQVAPQAFPIIPLSYSANGGKGKTHPQKRLFPFID